MARRASTKIDPDKAREDEPEVDAEDAEDESNDEAEASADEAPAKPRSASQSGRKPAAKAPEPKAEKADEGANEGEMLVRLLDYDKQLGRVTKHYAVEGYRFRCGDAPQAVPAALGRYLAKVTNPGPRAALAFEVRPAKG